MAKSYTSTLPIKCWKQQTCAGCGCTYAYVFERKAVGTGGSPDRARVAMQKRIEFLTTKDTDMHPCPECGLYQFDMIGQRRARSRMQFFWLALIPMVTLIILRISYAMQSTTLTWIAAGICGFVTVAHLLLETSNVNRDLPANREKGQAELAVGVLRATPAAHRLGESEKLARPSRSMLHVLGLVLLVFSVLLMLAPAAMLAVHQLPVNMECYPPVVGPTDTTRVYMTESITSIKGYWRGDPRVRLLYDGGPVEGHEATVTANQNDWDSTINNVKDSERNTRSHPWVEITMPDDPGMVGKLVRCEISLNVEYPQYTGSSSFQSQSSMMNHRLNIKTAWRGAGANYNLFWWMCTSVGGALVLIASLILYYQARRFQRRAQPTQVFPINPPELPAV